MGKQAKKRQDVILNENSNEDQDEVFSSPSAPAPASPSISGFTSPSAPGSVLSPPVSPSASHSGPASFLLVFLSASCSGPAFFLPVSSFASCSNSALPLLFSIPASRFGLASFPSNFESCSPVSPIFIGRAFFSVLSRNSLVCRQSAS